MDRKFWPAVVVSSVAFIALCAGLSACGAAEPATNQTSQNIYYYYEPQGKVCYAALYNVAANAFGVPCTAEVLTLAGYATTTPATETVR